MLTKHPRDRHEVVHTPRVAMAKSNSRDYVDKSGPFNSAHNPWQPHDIKMRMTGSRRGGDGGEGMSPGREEENPHQMLRRQASHRRSEQGPGGRGGRDDRTRDETFSNTGALLGTLLGRRVAGTRLASFSLAYRRRCLWCFGVLFFLHSCASPKNLVAGLNRVRVHPTPSKPRNASWRGKGG